MALVSFDGLLRWVLDLRAVNVVTAVAVIASFVGSPWYQRLLLQSWFGHEQPDGAAIQTPPPAGEGDLQITASEQNKSRKSGGDQISKDLGKLNTDIANINVSLKTAAEAAGAFKRDIARLETKLNDLANQAATNEALDNAVSKIDEEIGRLSKEKGTLQAQTTTLQDELLVLKESLQEETGWRELILKTERQDPHQHWSLLEKRWTLLKQNPVLRERLLRMWKSVPVQSLGEHFVRLLKQSARQWPTVRLQTNDAPGRLGYWRDLHTLSKRQLVAVSNFFKRLEQFDQSATFDDFVRGMTRAEFEIGWAHIKEPATVGELPPVQLDSYADVAARKLLETWATPVVLLHQELFVIPRYEYGESLQSLALEELDYTVNADGFRSSPEEDVAAAARQFEIEYIPIVPYDHHISEVTRYLNFAAKREVKIEEWLGYPRPLKDPLIVRVIKLALKRRASSAEMLDGGACVVLGMNADV